MLAKRPISTLLALLVLLPAARSLAQPAAAPRVVLAPPFLTGDTGKLEPRLRAALAEGIQRARVELAPAPRLATPPTSWCDAPTCFRDLGAALSADVLALARIDVQARAFEIEVAFVRVADGASLGSEQLRCAAEDPCAPLPASAREVAREAARKARPRLAEPPAPPEPLAEPLAVPATGADQPSDTAALRVADPVEDPGAGLAGESARAPETDGGPTPGGLPGWFWAGAAAIGTGALATGLALYALDGDGLQCAPRPGICRFNRDTRLAGVLSATGGLLTVTATTIFYLRQRHAPAAGVQDTPALSLSVGPGGIALGGRF